MTVEIISWSISTKVWYQARIELARHVTDCATNPVHMCLVVTCWEKADLLALVYGVQLEVWHFPIGILGQVWYLIILIPDLCTLTYYDLSPPPPPRWLRLLSVLMIYVLPIICGSSVFYLFCYALLCVNSSFAIILKWKRQLVGLLISWYRCIVTIIVLLLFSKVQWVGLQCVIVVFPDYTTLLFCRV